MATNSLPTSSTPSSKVRNFNRRICPHCGGREIYRCRARGIIERHVARAFRLFPHWCAECDQRFYVRLVS